MLYEYRNAEGEVVERVRPADDSPNAEIMVEKAADTDSGWSVVDEQADAEQTAKPARGRAAKIEQTAEVTP